MKDSQKLKKYKKVFNTYKFSVTLNKRMVLAIKNFCMEKSISDKDLTKMMILTSMVYRTQLRTEKPEVALYHGILRNLFTTKRYAEILDWCVELTIDIVKDADHLRGTCKVFKVVDELFDTEGDTFYPGNIDKPLYNNIIEQYREYHEMIKEFEVFSGDKRISIQNLYVKELKKIVRIESVVKYNEGLDTDKKKLKPNSLNILTSQLIPLNEGFDNIYSIDRNGRIYSILTSLPKKIRGIINFKYNECDLRQSHPRILSMLLCYITNKNETSLGLASYLDITKDAISRINNIKCPIFKRHKYYNTLTHKFINKLHKLSFDYYSYSIHFFDEDFFSNHETVWDSMTIYTNKKKNEKEKVVVTPKTLDADIQKFLRFFHYPNPDNFYGNISETIKLTDSQVKYYKGFVDENRLEDCTDVPKQILKTAFMYFLNGKPKGSEMAKLYSNLFPEIDKIIRYFKSEFNYKIWHSLITQIEANFVYQVIHECYQQNNDNVVGCLHDGLFYKKEFEKEFKEIFNRVSMQHFDECFPYK